MENTHEKLQKLLWNPEESNIGARSAMLNEVESLCDDRRTLETLRSLVQNFPFDDNDGRARIIADATELLGFDPHTTLPI